MGRHLGRNVEQRTGFGHDRGWQGGGLHDPRLFAAADPVRERQRSLGFAGDRRGLSRDAYETEREECGGPRSRPAGRRRRVADTAVAPRTTRSRAYRGASPLDPDTPARPIPASAAKAGGERPGWMIRPMEKIAADGSNRRPPEAPASARPPRPARAPSA